jgi:hypothetical protein
MSTQFDLEYQIMQCWGIIDDIKVVYTTHLDGERPLTEDELANIFIGMEYLYNIKFSNLMSTFEKLLKEIHESKVHDNSEVLRQEKSVTISGY